MIQITLQKIKDSDPCTDGWKKVLKARGGISANYGEEFPLSLILESNDLDDTLWATRCLPEHSSLWRKYAVWCVFQVRHLMTDRRSSDALDVAWRHSDGLATDDELAAAGAAAQAAAWYAEGGAAGEAAQGAAVAAEGDAAGDAAGAAARDAAQAAAWDAAVGTARDAAWDAAWAAARDAARAAQSAKLKQILDAGEWVE